MIDTFVLALNQNGFIAQEDLYKKLIVAYAIFCMAAEKERSYAYPTSLKRVKALCQEAGIDFSDQPFFTQPYDALNYFEDKMWRFVHNGQMAETTCPVREG